jgi:hypothetical protein
VDFVGVMLRARPMSKRKEFCPFRSRVERVIVDGLHKAWQSARPYFPTFDRVTRRFMREVLVIEVVGAW